MTLGRSVRGHHDLVILARCLLTVCFRLASQRGEECPTKLLEITLATIVQFFSELLSPLNCGEATKFGGHRNSLARWIKIVPFFFFFALGQFISKEGLHLRKLPELPAKQAPADCPSSSSVPGRTSSLNHKPK